MQARYTHGEETDQPLAMARGGGSYFYHVDHLGSVRLLTDAAGRVVSRYDYDSFGTLEPTSFEGTANPYGFTARERDAESGLMFYRARYYDPEIGRFISEDPIGFEAGDLNVYRYVANSPLVLADPLGEAAVDYGYVVGRALMHAAWSFGLTGGDPCYAGVGFAGGGAATLGGEIAKVFFKLAGTMRAVAAAGAGIVAAVPMLLYCGFPDPLWD